MLNFIGSYEQLDGRGLNISLCLAKSELLEQEIAYPPYAWMQQMARRTDIKAYEAKAFLECVRH